MSTLRIVAFDGTPVAGGAGLRTPLIQHSDGAITTSDERQVSDTDFTHLAGEGYVTRVDFETDHAEGVVAYRHEEFVLAGAGLEEDGVNWTAFGAIFACYLRPHEASIVFGRYARIALMLARAALFKGDYKSARLLARRGLMVEPELRHSAIAAQLYGVLLGAEAVDPQSKSIQREVELMLDGDRATLANRAAAEVIQSRTPSADLRWSDRLLRVGMTRAPRRAA